MITHGQLESTQAYHLPGFQTDAGDWARVEEEGPFTCQNCRINAVDDPEMYCQECEDMINDPDYR